jgi:hypothetical protein
VFYQNTLDVLDVPFRIRPDVTIPVGAYSMNEWYFTVNTSPGRRLYERVTVSPVQFYGGTRLNLAAAAGIRASSRLSAEMQYNRNDVKMPWGDFLVNLSTVRVDYTFTPRMTIRSLTQYKRLDARDLQQRALQLHLPARQRHLRRLQRSVADRTPRRISSAGRIGNSWSRPPTCCKR